MCNDSMNALDQNPSSAGISGTTQTAAGKCCWCEEPAKIVSADAVAKYYNDSASPPGQFRSDKQYQVNIKLKSLEAILVVTAKFLNTSGVEESAVENLKNEWQSASHKQWNQSQYKLRVTDPECGTKDLKIKHALQWVESGQHIEVRFQSGKVRANVQGKVMQVGTTSNGWTFSHEIGHVIGLPDEYTDQGNKTVAYRKPNGTFGPGIKKRIDGVDSTANSNIMSAAGATKIEARHFWPLATEAQELLIKSLGRSIKCDIV